MKTKITTLILVIGLFSIIQANPTPYDYGIWAYIDNFTTPSPPITITIKENSIFPLLNTSYTTNTVPGSYILTGERDLIIIQTEEAPIGSLFSAEVVNNQLKIITSNFSASSFQTILQYDGFDQSPILNLEEREGENFRACLYAGYPPYRYNQFCTDIRVPIYSNCTFDVLLEIFVYSGSSYENYCYYSTTSRGNLLISFYSLIEIGDGCNFNDVRAVQLVVHLPEDELCEVDLDRIGLYGHREQSKTSTPTISTSPSISITSSSVSPSISISASPSPSISQSPSYSSTITASMECSSPPPSPTKLKPCKPHW